MHDFILRTIYQQVQLKEKPEDNPVEAWQVGEKVGIAPEQLMRYCEALLQDGFIKISPLGTSPLLYLTITGLSRAKRLAAVPS